MSFMSLDEVLWNLAREAVTHTGIDSRILATRGIRKLGAGQLRELAIRQVMDFIDTYRRADALAAERAAERAATAERIKEDVQRQAVKALLRTAESERRREGWFQDPSLLDWGRKCSDSGQPTTMLNALQRKAFLQWLGERYVDWYARGCASVKRAKLAGAYEDDETATFFEADFYEYGSREWYANERVRRVYDLVQQVAEQTRLETTEQLLSTVFALGDGRKTTWGKATIQEHKQRITLLTKNATGVIETAARHRAAIKMIQSAGVSCLNEIEATP